MLTGLGCSDATEIAMPTTRRGGEAARSPALRRGWKSKHDPGAGAGLLFHRSVELVGQDADDAQAKRFTLSAQCAVRQADAIVLDGQLATARFGLAKGNQNPAGAPVGESVLEGVRQEFVQDQSARHGSVDAQFDGIQLQVKTDAFLFATKSRIYALHEIAGILAE